jgi:hypothetical protein
MRRFFITVAVGGLVATLGSFLEPHHEDPLAMVIIPMVLFPMRAGLRAFMRQHTQRTHAIVVASVLLAVVAAFTLGLPAGSFTMGRLSFFGFWAIYFVTLTLSFFWPLASEKKV